ncbi:hypothetical protein FLTE109939_10070 [Flavobacterium terrigena]|uniref:Uncharacterized protein n=1 Tax=Flavobacterium terrigena TaxID=402734 RepID=A0A1H6S3C4_9FLAO|nr:hypothetical protein SAMN05660918_1190 [Flavobacterium terrigena]
MLRVIKKFVTSILGYIPLILIFIIFFGVLALLGKLGLEIIRAVVGVLKEYWYITILLALIIIFLTGKSNDKK